MRKVTLYPNRKDTLVLSVDNTTEANLRIDTHSGVGCLVNWRDGNTQILPSGSAVTHVYATNFTDDVLVTPLGGYLDISRFESTGATAWNFDLNVFVPLIGLTDFRLRNLPNANITGSLNSFSGNNGLTVFQLSTLPNAYITGSINSFTGATGLTYFRLSDLPNANITGSFNSFSGANGLTNFHLYFLPNANITGDSSSFSNKTNLIEFWLYTSPTSNITMNYDDILNIWQSSVYIIHRDSGISASKATTASFNFSSLSYSILYFQNIGLSTASMDNMIIALDDSLIVQASPKNIYLNGNASHSGSPAVMTALSGLASKNITVVL